MRPAILLFLAAAAAAQTNGIATSAAADEALRQTVERLTYSLEDSGDGTYRGTNPMQRLTLEFNGREARLSHPRGSVTFHLTGFGYGDRLRTPQPARATGAGNRVEYRRGNLTEWYVNSPQGLEQGFTVARPPGTGREGGPLVIALGVSGDLAASRNGDDGSVLFESGSEAVLRYAGLTALDARGRKLPSRMEAHDGAIRLIVDSRGARYPVVVDPIWTQQQELTASDGARSDLFGASVSVSGDTAVVGANAKNTYHGAAYVFVRTAGVWTQQQKLTAADGATGDNFGNSVSLAGDTVVIGAPYHVSSQGAAYVFVRSSGVWSQQQELTGSDGAAYDNFGEAVALSGDTAVVGALAKNGYRGAAYVFVRNSGVWSQQQKLTASDSSANDLFGTAVAVNADTAVISSPSKLSSQGVTYVFVRSGSVWSQQQELTACNGGTGLFGNSVSVSGDTAVMGASSNNSSQGAACVFVRNAGVWSQQQTLTASDGAAGDNFGISASVSGDTAVIGAYGNNSSQGAAYLFVRSGGVWTQQQKLTASDGATGDQFGRFASLGGDTAVIGAYDRNHYQGAAYVFVRPRLGAGALLVGSAAGASSVALSTGAAWTATANDSFLHISSGSSSGTGSGAVIFTYDSFAGTGYRTGTLTIAGLTVTVTQAGTNYVSPGPATVLVSSGLSQPAGVAVDGSGNVYIADSANGAIKEWSASTQIVTTLVSYGLNQPAGVAVDSSGNVYIADTGNSAIKEWAASTQLVTTLVSSGLSQPTGVTVDNSGNVYIADTGNSAIKEWSASTHLVTTLVSSGLSSPRSVTADVSGNVYIADTGNSAIKEWNAATHLVTTLVSSGLSSPRGTAVDGSGNIYIADTGNNAIKEWCAATQHVTALVSPGAGAPSGIAVDGGDNLYIATPSAGAIAEVPFAFVGPSSFSEPAAGGSDSLLAVLPVGTSFAGIFAPTSDQSWLTMGAIAGGVVSFSFTANTSASRTAHIGVLGQSIPVTQAGLAAQSITFGALGNQAFGTAPFALSATATSGLAVSFTSQTTSVCTVSGATVTVVGAGTCTIQATQAGNSNWSAATPVSESFTVTPGSQTIAFGALLGQVFGEAPFAVSATATSGLAVSFASTTLSVCTVSGVTVTVVGVGTCTIQATQAGNSNYAAATAVSQGFTVTPGSQTITFGALSGQVFGSAPFTVSGSASSGLAVSFASTTSSVCTVSGVTVTLVAAGTCTIQATQGGNGNWAAATPVREGFMVTPGSQAITFGGLSSQVFGTAPFALSATATSGLAVSFTSQTTSVCTVSGATVTVLGVGTCTLQATQGGNTNWSAATPVSQSFAVTPGSQAITFGGLSSQVFGAAPFAVVATATSGLTVSFNSQTTSVCTVSGATVTVVGVGTCTIQATQAGNTNYAAAAPAAQSFQVTQGSQLGANALIVSSAAGMSSVTLSYSGSWTATSNDSFLHVSPGSTSGAGSGVVIFGYDAFTGTGSRTGTLTISGLTLTVTQAGVDYVGQGPVTTLVSSGLAAPDGVAVDGSGNVYIADRLNGVVREWNRSTQQVTALVAAGLSNPDGVAVDGAGDVYIADTGNNAIRKWSASTQQVTTPIPTALLSPTGLAVDGAGNVYIADTGNHAIKEWIASTRQVTTLAPTGQSGPDGVAVDGAGNVYFSDAKNNAVKVWSPLTQQVTTLIPAGLLSPAGLALDASGNVYIADTGHHAIAEWSASTGQLTAVLSTGAGQPGGVAVDGSGNVYLSDVVTNTVEAMPLAFTGPANLTEPASAGSDTLLPVLPSTASLTGVFQPESDQDWLTIGTTAGGVIGFSVTANPSPFARTAHITVLGRQSTITQSPASVAALTVTLTHKGSVTQGQNGVPYTVTVSNAAGASQSTGTVSLTETIPTGLTLVSMTGTGWNCADNTCTRSDALNAGSSYPALAVLVNAAADAPSPVTNQVSVSWGGSASATAYDPTSIAVFTCDVTGDGKTNVMDMQTIINEALGVMPAVHDLNHDGVVNVADVQKVLDAILGLGCPYY